MDQFTNKLSSLFDEIWLIKILYTSSYDHIIYLYNMSTYSLVKHNIINKSTNIISHMVPIQYRHNTFSIHNSMYYVDEHHRKIFRIDAHGNETSIYVKCPYHKDYAKGFSYYGTYDDHIIVITKSDLKNYMEIYDSNLQYLYENDCNAGEHCVLHQGRWYFTMKNIATNKHDMRSIDYYVDSIDVDSSITDHTNSEEIVWLWKNGNYIYSTGYNNNKALIHVLHNNKIINKLDIPDEDYQSTMGNPFICEDEYYFVQYKPNHDVHITSKYDQNKRIFVGKSDSKLRNLTIIKSKLLLLYLISPNGCFMIRSVNLNDLTIHNIDYNINVLMTHNINYNIHFYAAIDEYHIINEYSFLINSPII